MTFSILLGVAFAHLLAVASPGPDFLAVLKTTLQYGRKSGVLVSAGISCGLILHCIFALTVLSSLIHWMPNILPIMQFVSGFYLLFLAFQCVRSKNQNEDSNIEKNTFSPFLVGLITNGTNPKVFVYISAMFTTLAGQFKPTILIGISLYISLQTFAWFVMVSFLFCQKTTRNLYYSHQKKIDLAMAIILIYFAAYLLLLNK